MTFDQLYTMRQAPAGFPQVRRARENCFYAGGTRWIDLWQGGGSLFLGARPDGMGQAAKNVLERGLWPALPTVELRRLLAALAGFDGGRWKVRFVPCAPGCDSRANFADPAQGESGGDALWRPALPRDPGARRLLLVLPCPAAWAPWVLLEAAGQDTGQGQGAPDCAPDPITAAIILRCLQVLKRMPPRGDYFPGGLPGWARRGPYLSWQGEDTAYDALRLKALDKGVILPQTPRFPAILPAALSGGSQALVKDALTPTGRTNE